LCFQGHSLSGHLTDEQRAEMKAYMSLVNSVFVNAVVCRCVFTAHVFCFVAASTCYFMDELKLNWCWPAVAIVVFQALCVGEGAELIRAAEDHKWVQSEKHLEMNEPRQALEGHHLPVLALAHPFPDVFHWQLLANLLMLFFGANQHLVQYTCWPGLGWIHIDTSASPHTCVLVVVNLSLHVFQ